MKSTSFVIVLLSCILLSYAAVAFPSWDADDTLLYVDESAYAYNFNCLTSGFSSGCPSQTKFSFDFSKFPCVVLKTCSIRMVFHYETDEVDNYAKGTLKYVSNDKTVTFDEYQFVDYQSNGASVEVIAVESYTSFVIRIYKYPIVTTSAFGELSGEDYAILGFHLPNNHKNWSNIDNNVTAASELEKYVVDVDGNSMSLIDDDAYLFFYPEDDGTITETTMAIFATRLTCRVLFFKILQDFVPAHYNHPPEGISYLVDNNGVTAYPLYVGGDWNNLPSIDFDLTNKVVSVTSDLTFNSDNFEYTQWNILGHSTYFSGTTLSIDFRSESCVEDGTCFGRVNPGREMNIYYGQDTSGESFTTSNSYPLDFSKGKQIFVSFSNWAYNFSINLYDDEAIIIQEIKHLVRESSLKIIHQSNYDTFVRTTTDVTEREQIDISSFVTSGSVKGYIQDDYIELIFTERSVINLDGIMTKYAPEFNPNIISVVDSDEGYNIYNNKRLSNISNARSTENFTAMVLSTAGGTIRSLVTDTTSSWERFYEEYQMPIIIAAVVMVMLLLTCCLMCCCKGKEETVIVGGAPMMQPVMMNSMGQPMSMGAPMMGAPGMAPSMGNPMGMGMGPSMGNPMGGMGPSMGGGMGNPSSMRGAPPGTGSMAARGGMNNPSGMRGGPGNMGGSPSMRGRPNMQHPLTPDQ